MNRAFPLRAAIAVVAAVALLAANPANAVPPAFRRTDVRALVRGVTHETYASIAGEQAVHVARIAKRAAVELRPVLAQGTAGASLERTSAMCVRVRCIAAVNGDFYSPAGPVGGVAIGDRPLRSPNGRHHQLILGADGDLSTGPMRWHIKLVPTDLRDVIVDGLNVERGRNGLVLYTPAFGPSTGTNEFGVELVLAGAGALRLGRTIVVQARTLRRGGDTAIPANSVVLSGHGRGARALEELWQRMTSDEISRSALLRVTSDPDAVGTIGGTPILVRNGARWFADEARAFVRGHHPRTMVGWTKSGSTLLVTVDGRQPGYSRGMSLAEAADLMIELGAVEAINMDGGGSSTFVVAGRVANRPSDVLVRRGGSTAVVHAARRSDRIVGNVERPVAVALAVVPVGKAAPATRPADPGVLALPPEKGEIVSRFDVASDPSSALPALIGSAPLEADLRLPLAIVALLMLLSNVAALSALGGARWRTRLARALDSSS